MTRSFLKILFFLHFGLIVENVSAQTGKFSEKDLTPLRGLKGIWKMDTGNKELFEEWKDALDGQLAGKSYQISAGARKELESVRIFSIGSNVYYAPIAFGQNSDQEVLFALKEINRGQYIFENKQHDFPQRIAYQLIGRDSLHAYIEGEIEGKLKRINFRYALQNSVSATSK
jgi:hypothetical protein